jgi:hypothetical protein
MRIESNHARPGADPADDATQSVNADFIEADGLHFFAYYLDDVLFFGRMRWSADEITENANSFLFKSAGAGVYRHHG